MDTWTPEEVSDWLHTEFNISNEQAKTFRDQEISGKNLVKFTEKRLEDAPFFLKIGTAMNIMERIEDFLKSSGKLLLMFTFHSLPCQIMAFAQLAMLSP